MVSLDEIFRSEHRIPRQVLQRLDASQFAELREVALGQRQAEYRVRAMDTLVLAQAPQAAEVLDLVALTPGGDVSLRAVALRQIARLGAPGAEKSLLKVLESPSEELLLISASRGLASVGGMDAVPELDALARRSSGAVQLQARYAAAVIAHRAGIAGHEPSIPTEKDLLRASSRAVPFKFAQAEKLVTERAVDDLRTARYGIELDAGLMWSIACGSRRLLIALDPRWLKPSFSDNAKRRPLVAGLMASANPVDGSYVPRGLILTWPGPGDKIFVSINMPSGTPMFFGTALSTNAAGVKFDLAAVAGRGATGVTVRGKMTDAAVTISEGKSDQQKSRPTGPRPISPPSPRIGTLKT